jgi:integrase
MARKKAARTRGTSPHPGVVIEKPDANSGTGYRMRWRDPVSGKIRRAKCRLLLRAALEHDRVCFKETRKEHAGEAEPGSTARYAAIAPFVAVVMLSGMRRGEALNLTWRDFNEDERMILLRATATKTKRARRST